MHMTKPPLLLERRGHIGLLFAFALFLLWNCNLVRARRGYRDDDDDDDEEVVHTHEIYVP